MWNQFTYGKTSNSWIECYIVPRAQKSPFSKWTNRAPAVVRQRDQPGRRPGQTTGQTGLPQTWSDNGPAWGLCSLPTHTFPCAIMINARNAGPEYYALLFSRSAESAPLAWFCILQTPLLLLLLLWGSSTPERPFCRGFCPCVCITPFGTGLGRSNILLSEISHKMQKK
jgi:hypothetical protein